MRRTSRDAVLFAALTALVVAIPASAQQVSVSGTWDLTWETPRGAQTVTFVFAQDGMNVTGTARLRMGEVAIKDGMLHGDQFSFALEMRMGQRTMAQTFTATVVGDAMEGKVNTPRGENPFKGVRKKKG